MYYNIQLCDDLAALLVDDAFSSHYTWTGRGSFLFADCILPCAEAEVDVEMGWNPGGTKNTEN